MKKPSMVVLTQRCSRSPLPTLNQSSDPLPTKVKAVLVVGAVAGEVAAGHALRRVDERLDLVCEVGGDHRADLCRGRRAEPQRHGQLGLRAVPILSHTAQVSC